MSESVTVETAAAPRDFADKALGLMASFAVAWGLLGLVSFVFYVTLDIETLHNTYASEQVNYILDTPVWARAGHALGVMGMLVGSVYMLMRRKSAYHWFMYSLVGTLLVLLDSILRNGFGIMGGMETGVNIAVIIVGIFLFWAAYSAYQEGQLK